MREVHNLDTLSCELSPEIVDVWFASPVSPDVLFQSVLSPAEVQRAASFRSLEHVNKFITRHGVLRLILARYIGKPAESLAFTYTRLGKPSLQTIDEIRFSMSHSDDMAVYAVARERDVGIDVERNCDAPHEFPQIAKSFFSRREIETLNASPADRKSEMFLRLWTQHEAKAKACGSGIADPLRAWDSFSGRCFSVLRSDPKPGYIVGLAVQGQEQCNLRMHQFAMPDTASLTETRLQSCLRTFS